MEVALGLVAVVAIGLFCVVAHHHARWFVEAIGLFPPHRVLRMTRAFKFATACGAVLSVLGFVVIAVNGS